MGINYGPFTYKVRILSDILEGETEDAFGILFADDYVDAMRKIEEYYGRDLIEVLSIFGLDNNSVLELPADIYERVRELGY